MLELLYETTDLLIRDRSGPYALRARCRGYYQLGSQLDKFIGGYGSAVAHFNGSVKGVRRSRTHFVDRERLAQAFDRASPSGPSIAGHVLRTYGVRTLVDIGCGPAAVLVELGTADADFRGWGLDASPQMCALAERRVASAGLADRVQIHRTDVRRLGRALDAATRHTIEAIYGGSILNEFFADGSSEVIRILRQLRRQFPGRLLFVQD
ncbi:MAG: methyltransferase domain-containing protein [Chloroflexi bacterium]|nr:methyltransferase domain-containing protein [Chloroflexota bacterium]